MTGFHCVTRVHRQSGYSGVATAAKGWAARAPGRANRMLYLGPRQQGAAVKHGVAPTRSNARLTEPQPTARRGTAHGGGAPPAGGHANGVTRPPPPATAPSRSSAARRPASPVGSRHV
jgi:hypothetical protein